MNTGRSSGSFDAKSGGSSYSPTSQSSAPQKGGATRNSPATGFSTATSERYFNRIEAPRECPTRTVSPSKAESTSEIRSLHAPYSGLSASGIRGHRTSYAAPSTSRRLSASFLSSSYASSPPPWTNRTCFFIAPLSSMLLSRPGFRGRVEEGEDLSAGREPGLDEAARALGLAVEEADADREDLLEAAVSQEAEVLEVGDKELGPAGLHVRRVPARRGLDHPGRAIDGGEMSFLQALADERRRDPVAAADLEHPVVRPEAESLDHRTQPLAHEAARSLLAGGMFWLRRKRFVGSDPPLISSRV